MERKPGLTSVSARTSHSPSAISLVKQKTSPSTTTPGWGPLARTTAPPAGCAQKDLNPEKRVRTSAEIHYILLAGDSSLVSLIFRTVFRLVLVLRDSVLARMGVKAFQSWRRLAVGQRDKWANGQGQPWGLTQSAIREGEKPNVLEGRTAFKVEDRQELSKRRDGQPKDSQ